MIHQASRKFWDYYHKLPDEVQSLADKDYQLLKISPYHPSLHLKKVGKYWSVRIGLSYRALAIEYDQTLVWFWIGQHDEYIRLIQE